MATLPTKDIPTLNEDQVTAIQALSDQQLDFSVGSVELAIVESNSGVAFWLESIGVDILPTTRASTSEGSDLDTWMADYNFFRDPADPATGLVTFSRSVATQQAIISVGTLVQSQIGQVQYAVYADSTNMYFNPMMNAYVIPVSTTNINVPVAAVIAGAAGNVPANTITVIVGGIPGVQFVNNSSAFTNGADQESDMAFRARFVLYINSLSKACEAAIQNAISSVQTGILYNIVENLNYSGGTQLGYFYAVIDDGSGSPPDSLVTSVINAINAVRGLTIQFDVFKTTAVTFPVVATIKINPSYTWTAIEAIIETAITTYINSLPVGGTIQYFTLGCVILNSSPAVEDISAFTLNGGTSDITVTNHQSPKVGTITLTQS